MSNDKIEEIRARHKAVTWCFYELKSQIHDDREVLLAEVERLTRERDEARAEVERLRGTIRQVALAADGCISRDKIVCICHEALEARP